MLWPRRAFFTDKIPPRRRSSAVSEVALLAKTLLVCGGRRFVVYFCVEEIPQKDSAE
jgi:hypothetical protein